MSDSPPIDQDSFDRALLSTLITTLVFSAVALILFHLCKQWRKQYYHRNPTHPDDSASPFHWFYTTLVYPQNDILTNQGFDAYLSLELVKLYMGLILMFCFYSILILIPINASGHNRFREDNFTLINETLYLNQTIDKAECFCVCQREYNLTTYPVNGTALISLSNIYNNLYDDGKIYAHGISVIWNSVWTWIGLWIVYNRYIVFRQAYRVQPKVYNYSVVLQGYNVDKWDEATLKNYLEALFGAGSIYSIHSVPSAQSIGQMEALRSKRMELVLHVESLKEDLKKKPSPRLDQDIRISYARIHKCESRLADLMNQKVPWNYGLTERKEMFQGSHKTINHYLARRKGQGLNDVIYSDIDEMENSKKIIVDQQYATNFTFVTFNSMKVARLCARAFLAMDPYFRAKPAPTPDDVRWQNIGYIENGIMVKAMKVLGFATYMIVAVLWMIPVAFAVSLTNLSNLVLFFPFLEPIVDALSAVPVIKGFVEGFFPQLILIMFFYFLEPILAFIGDIFWRPFSSAHLEHLLMNACFTFKVINIYLGGIIASSFLSIFAQVSEIAQQPFTVVTILGASMPQQANFFLNLLLTNGLYDASMSLLGPLDLIIYLFYSCLAKTPREKSELHAPVGGSYGPLLADHNFIMLLVFTYSTITPLILPIALIYFACSFVAQKYFILYHTEPGEGGGELWPVVFSQLCIALVVYHLVMIGVFLGVKFTFGVVVTALCLVGTAVFWYYMDTVWRPHTYYSSLEDVAPVSPPNLDTLNEEHEWDYTHPLLLPLDEDELEWKDPVPTTTSGDALDSLG